MELLQYKSIIKVENSVEGLNGRVELAKEKISKCKARVIEVMHLKNREKKKELRKIKSLKKWALLSIPV